MRFQWALFVLTYLLLFSCHRQEKKQHDFVQAIQQTGKLVTAEYTLSKMVRANDNKTWYKWGDRRILIAIEAVVKAGVDLQAVSPADVTFSDSTINLRLPPSQIFSVSIPPDKIKVLYEDVSLFRERFSAAEREALLRQAEAQVRQLADSLGVLKTAEVNAAVFLRRLLQQGAYQNATIRFEK